MISKETLNWVYWYTSVILAKVGGSQVEGFSDQLARPCLKILRGGQRCAQQPQVQSPVSQTKQNNTKKPSKQIVRIIPYK